MAEATIAGKITPVTVSEFMEHEQLTYMLYTLTDRAIPLSTTGIKPGASRLLYSMMQDKVLPGTKARKSAKLTSAATGAYHPHGQAAMYGPLAAFAAPFARINLIDGVGAFGQTPGDPPAADRYTEARLSEVGYAMVKEVAEGAVPMRPTYDNETTEPWWLPVPFPILLCVGALGMGEGWSTRTPAHNPREVVDATVFRLDHPDCGVDDIMGIMPGPDWGTGGRVIGDQSGIRDYYTTGQGKMTVQGTWHIDGPDIIITEVPPAVSVPTLLDGNNGGGLRDKARQGIIPGISDVSNLSDRQHGLRIVISCKRGHKPADVMDAVLRETEMETTYAASIVALDSTFTPRWWGVMDLIDEFISMRDDVVTRRCHHRLDTITSRLTRARAVAAVVVDKDRTVAIITGAANRVAAEEAIAGAFDLDGEQAAHVVGLPLHRLTKADVLDATKRVEALEKEADTLRELIGSASARRDVIRRELVEARRMLEADTFDRRTVLDATTRPISAGDSVDDGDRLTQWRLDDTNASIGAHGTPIPEGASIYVAFHNGKIKRFAGAGLPKKIVDKPLAPMVDTIHSCGLIHPGQSLLFVTKHATKKSGRVANVLRVAYPERAQGLNSNGVAGIKLTDGDELLAVYPVDDDDQLMMVSDAGWKVVAVADLMVKGQGSKGEGLYRFTRHEDGLVAAAVGKRFEVDGEQVNPVAKIRTPHREAPAHWRAVGD